MRTVVRARIDEKTWEEAAAVLDAVGLTVSDAFRLMMVRIPAEKRLSFEPLAPNAETVAPITAARRGELVTVGDVDGLMIDLHADDRADRDLQTRLPAFVAMRARNPWRRLRTSVRRLKGALHLASPLVAARTWRWLRDGPIKCSGHSV